MQMSDSALLRKIRAVVFHSFCGGMYEVEGILGKGINAYFSFGKQILNGNKKSIECVRFLPLDGGFGNRCTFSDS